MACGGHKGCPRRNKTDLGYYVGFRLSRACFRAPFCLLPNYLARKTRNVSKELLTSLFRAENVLHRFLRSLSRTCGNNAGNSAGCNGERNSGLHFALAYIFSSRLIWIKCNMLTGNQRTQPKLAHAYDIFSALKYCALRYP